MDGVCDNDELRKLMGEHKSAERNDSAGHRGRVRAAMDRNPDLSSFADYELLEYLLFATNPRQDTKPLAKELIRMFGSLSAVLHADFYELKRVPGVGDQTAHLLSNVLQIVLRAEYSRFEHPCVLRTAAETAQYMYARFLWRTKEALLMTSLNINDEVIQTDEISVGSVDATSFDIVKLLRCADRNGAKKIILAHNHPGGTLDFSQADIQSTARVVTCCDLLGYTFVDHLVFVGNRYISMFAKDKLSAVLSVCEKHYNAIAKNTAKEQTLRSKLAKMGETGDIGEENARKLKMLYMLSELADMDDCDKRSIMDELIHTVNE